MSLLISGKDQENIRQVERLARKLGLTIEYTEDISTPTQQDNLFQLMNKKAKEGGITSIKNPEEWQKQVREDKPLYGREK